MNDQRVLIAGGGPVGLVCAYALGLVGVPVVVFDENDALQMDTLGHHPPGDAGVARPDWRRR